MTIQPSVLLVEDDKDLGVMLCEFMQYFGFSYELAQDGNVAVELLAGTTPSVILLDLHLPGLSGQEILAVIAADDRLASTRVIVITADLYADPDELYRADAILVKPFTILALRKAIDRVMNGDSNTAARPVRLSSSL